MDNFKLVLLVEFLHLDIQVEVIKYLVELIQLLYPSRDNTRDVGSSIQDGMIIW